MKKVIIFLFIIFFSLLFSYIISASISIENYSIIPDYGPNATVIGSINLSLSNVSSNAYFTTNFGQNISLKSLLNMQSEFNFSCSTTDCNSTYSPVGIGSDSQQFSLNAGQSELLGFLISSNSGSVNSVSDFSLNVTSDALSSNTPQLNIDLLDDKNPEWIAYQPSGNFGQSKGCYSSSDWNAGDTALLGSTPFCEKINLPISPDVSLSAQISGTGTSKLTMTIQDVNQTSKGSCTATPSYGSLSCIPQLSNSVYGGNYPITNGGDFYVCISNPLNGNYSLNIEHENEPVNSGQCGFYASTYPSANYTLDFPIFAQSDSFAPVGSFILNDTESGNSWYHVTNLESEIDNYLASKYNNNCINGCVIPISLNAFMNQDINLSNFQLIATTTTTGNRPFYGIYNIQETPALISSKGYQNLILDNANISLPGSFGQDNLTLMLVDGKNSYPVLSTTINIEQIPQVTSITPSTTSAALPTNFSANINTYGSNATITSYKWNFGDNSSIVTTSTNTVPHTYSQTGGFNLQVTITNSLGMASTSNFTISVVSPRDAVNQILQQQLNNLANIQNQMGNFQGFTQSALNQTLNLGNVSIVLQNDQIANQSASTDNQYISILQSLLQINLPQSIQQTQSASSVPFLPTASSIDLNTLQKIGGGTFDSSRQNDYVNSILSWDLSNANIDVDYNEFSAVYNNGNSLPILDVVTLNINQNPSRNNSYLVIPSLNNLILSSNFSQTGSYYYIPIGSNSQIVEFATSQSVSPTQLPIFVAPSLDQIPLPQQSTPSNNKMLIFILIIAAIIIVGVTSYILLGRWYQKRYESYLFKDKNDLYNIVNYIQGAKLKGLDDNQIEKNLKKSQWTSEQITYLMKKYAGKSVGVPGFVRKRIKK